MRVNWTSSIEKYYINFCFPKWKTPYPKPDRHRACFGLYKGKCIIKLKASVKATANYKGASAKEVKVVVTVR